MFYLRSGSSQILNSLATGFEVATYTLGDVSLYFHRTPTPPRECGLITTLFPSIGHAPEKQKSQLFSRPPDPPISKGYSQVCEP